MVVFTGGHASGFKNLHDKNSYDTDGVMLFQVKFFNVAKLDHAKPDMNRCVALAQKTCEPSRWRKKRVPSTLTTLSTWSPTKTTICGLGR
jgi:hypothetical protein